MNLFQLAVAALLFLTALFIFRRVGHDYQTLQRLTPLSTLLETLIFFLHGVASYAFLDSRLVSVNTGSPLFIVAVLCIGVGLVLVAVSMGWLGMGKSLGRDVTGLQQTGLYRYTRNPQIVAYGLVVIGYALLWPAWSGLVWVVTYGLIAQIMVRTEERHLRRVYSQAYEDYCIHTPRYLGWPGKDTAG